MASMCHLASERHARAVATLDLTEHRDFDCAKDVTEFVSRPDVPRSALGAVPRQGQLAPQA